MLRCVHSFFCICKKTVSKISDINISKKALHKLAALGHQCSPGFLAVFSDDTFDTARTVHKEDIAEPTVFWHAVSFFQMTCVQGRWWWCVS